MSSITELSWNGVSFWAKLQLFVLALVHFWRSSSPYPWNRRENASLYSELSSTYYSIAGSVVAAGRRLWKPGRRRWVWLTVPWWVFTWLPLGAWCYWRMLPLSNQVVRLLGIDQMDPDQLDIRQSILRKHRRYYEAFECIAEALSRSTLKPHTRGFLLVSKAEVLYRNGELPKVMECINLAIQATYEASSVGETKQAIRLWRRCAEMLNRVGDSVSARFYHNLARVWSQESQVGDQILKL